MHIRNDPSFFFTNKTGAPQGEELCPSICLVAQLFQLAPITLSFLKAPIDKVPVLQVQHQVPNQFETPLIKSEEDPTSPQEILQESLKLLARPPKSASSPTYLQLPMHRHGCQKDRKSFFHVLLRDANNLLGTHNDRLIKDIRTARDLVSKDKMIWCGEGLVVGKEAGLPVLNASVSHLEWTDHL
ncbi:hypothetical protein Tco_1237009 [Tanacetum coccineum]